MKNLFLLQVVLLCVSGTSLLCAFYLVATLSVSRWRSKPGSASHSALVALIRARSGTHQLARSSADNLLWRARLWQMRGSRRATSGSIIMHDFVFSLSFYQLLLSASLFVNVLLAFVTSAPRHSPHSEEHLKHYFSHCTREAARVRFLKCMPLLAATTLSMTSIVLFYLLLSVAVLSAVASGQSLAPISDGRHFKRKARATAIGSDFLRIPPTQSQNRKQQIMRLFGISSKKTSANPRISVDCAKDSDGAIDGSVQRGTVSISAVASDCCFEQSADRSSSDSETYAATMESTLIKGSGYDHFYASVDPQTDASLAEATADYYQTVHHTASGRWQRCEDWFGQVLIGCLRFVCCKTLDEPLADESENSSEPLVSSLSMFLTHVRICLVSAIVCALQCYLQWRRCKLMALPLATVLVCILLANVLIFAALRFCYPFFVVSKSPLIQSACVYLIAFVALFLFPAAYDVFLVSETSTPHSKWLFYAQCVSLNSSGMATLLVWLIFDSKTLECNCRRNRESVGDERVFVDAMADGSSHVGASVCVAKTDLILKKEGIGSVLQPETDGYLSLEGTGASEHCGYESILDKEHSRFRSDKDATGMDAVSGFFHAKRSPKKDTCESPPSSRLPLFNEHFED